MKKLYLLSLLSFSLLCLSTAAMAAARTIAFDFTDATNPWGLPQEYVLGEHSYTNDSLTVLINGAGYFDKDTTKGGAQLYMSKDSSVVALMMGKKNSYITLPAMPFAVRSIRTFGVTGGSAAVTYNVYVGDTAVSTQVKGCSTDQEFKITKSHNTPGHCYTIRVNNANNIRLGRILVTEAVAGAPEKPVFSPKSGTFTTPQLVALTCPTDSTTILYSVDGGNTFSTYTSPILIEQTTTILAQATKNELVSEMTSATYTIVSTTGSGTKDDPYTVADVALLNNPGDSAWVTGIILGCPNSKGKLALKDTTDNNILLGTLATDSIGVPVNLAKKAIKEAVGLATNPGNKGRTIKVYGALVEYFKVPGVQKTSDYEIIVPAGTPETPKFSLPSGTYITEQTVAITCATDSATIYYSYNGESFDLYTDPLLISAPTTLYAKAEKAGLTSGVAQATYTFYTPIGSGTEYDPYTVTDLRYMDNPGDTAWVGGYIIGCGNSNGNLMPDSVNSNNVLIADSAAATIGAPVRLSTDELKQVVGLVDHPNNRGKFLKVYGKMAKYLSKPGVVNVSDYILEGVSTSIHPITPHPSPLTKILREGQLVILRDGIYYNALGNPIY